MQLMDYQPEYFEELLETINAADRVDGANLGTTGPELAHTLQHQPPGTVCVALEGSTVVGYIRLEQRPPTGDQAPSVVCLGIVHPEYRRRGTGTALVKWAKERAGNMMQGGPCKFLIPVRHSVRGLQELVEALNMHPKFFFHVLQYANLPALPRVPEQIDGITIRVYQSEADVGPYTTCLNQVFAQQTSVTAVRQVVNEPNFDPALWLFAFDGARLIGFCTCAGYQYEGEVEFLGVLPEYRGKGLGFALLSLGVRALAAKGYENIHLAVNVHNERALDIYKQVGFKEWRKSTTYALNLHPNN